LLIGALPIAQTYPSAGSTLPSDQRSPDILGRI
jgi:hypothetical protein